MRNFKVGDRVKIVGGGLVYQANDLGEEFTVTKVDQYRGNPYAAAETGPGWGGIYFDNLELVEDIVSAPSHYFHPSGIEVIEITRHETFVRGNIIKYVMRAPYKGDELTDLKKAREYLDMEIERVENA